MYCTKKIQDDLFWVGGNDRRLAMFEGVYSVPKGVSYNSYLLLDESTILFDTVDKAVSKVFFENITHVLNGRKLDYVVVHHMEPDHSATLSELIRRYPEVTVVCNNKSLTMIQQFFDVEFKYLIVKENDILNTGKHELTFLMAPMIHWPEVMMTFDKTAKILYSADAFGCFGALNGAVFADEVDFERDFLDEARRYYCNIVGKYGVQVQALLKKASAHDIQMICPLHGFVWRRNLSFYIEKYQAWSSYTPETTGVMIAYASVYGNTENAAEILSSRLHDMEIHSVMFDVSVTFASEIIAAAFKFSHLVFASTTYNAGVFVTMDELLRDLAAHNIQNRTVAFIQNGSWAPLSGKLMQEILSGCKNMNFLQPTVTLKSSIKESQSVEIDALVNAISSSMSNTESTPEVKPDAPVDSSALFNISYGLFVLTANDGVKDNGCIINTVQQITSQPKQISICVNKQNYTHDMIAKSGLFNVSVLAQEAPFDIFRHFGFQSGRDVNKFESIKNTYRSANGILYITEITNAVISGKVIGSYDCGTHTLFIAEVTEARKLSFVPSVTYEYYFSHIKPKPQQKYVSVGKIWICKICGYIYDEVKEGIPFDKLPDDWVCPLCKHPKSDFELQK